MAMASLLDATEVRPAMQRQGVIALLLGFLIIADPLAALAASGGRMGGSTSSSRSSSSSSRGRSSGFYGSTYSSSSSQFRSSSSSSWGRSSGFYGSTFSSSSSQFRQNPPQPAGKIELYEVLIFALALLAIFFIYLWWAAKQSPKEAPRVTVYKFQVCLLGITRILQKDLDWIAETADTSTSQGLHYVLTETVSALLRHPDCCISACSSVDVKRSKEDGEILFKHLSTEEYRKFDEETLVNLNNIKVRRTSTQRSKLSKGFSNEYIVIDTKQSNEDGAKLFKHRSIQEHSNFDEETLANLNDIKMRKTSSQISKSSQGFSNEYIVITILLAAKGEPKLPSVLKGSAGLREALQKLHLITSKEIVAVEVLWTPQKENDTLTEREVLEDYPLLRPLY